MTLDHELRQSLSMRPDATENPEVEEMRLNRRANARKTASVGGGMGSITLATQRPRDPMFYWKQNNLPYDPRNPYDLQRIREYCAHLYQAHPLLASAIDIFSKYPLAGMEIDSKDEELVDFYSELFFDQLDYEAFLPDVLKSYWIYGEAWPLGSFNDILGIWEDDELIPPDDVIVTKSPFSKEPRFEMRLPESIRNLIRTREPYWEYDKLIKMYPEFLYYQGEDSYMPISNVLLNQIAFKSDIFHPRGVPIMLRGMRAAMQEEMLNSAQDAIADRLYTPLVLFKLGATAQDLGTNDPWIPSPSDIDEFEQMVDAALAGDFRVLTHHFGVQTELVFGRESMPNFDMDFERLAERQLQTFGLSKTMLSGAQGGETYAADAINRDLVSQLLSGAQRLVKRHFRQRAEVVAEAREHWDYEVRGGKRYPIMEEVLEVDEETGEHRIVEQPKLLIPELRIKAMDLRREDEYRRFVEEAVAANVPISQKTRFVNVPIDLAEEREKVREEQVANAVAEQEARRQIYHELKANRLPVPADLEADFAPRASTAEAEIDEETTTVTPDSTPVKAPPTLNPNRPIPGLLPTQIDTIREERADRGLPDIRSRPPESDEQREGMPRTSAFVERLPQNSILMEGRTKPPSTPLPGPVPVAAAHRGWGHAEPLVMTELSIDGETSHVIAKDEDGSPIIGRMTHGPRHVGMRRFSVIRGDIPLEEQM